METEKLKAALAAHREWLESGGERGTRADLKGADLRNADLRGADLRDADLRDADLRGAVLRDADLRGAGLRNADLRGANMQGAALQGADLRGADLRGANMDYSCWPLWCGSLTARIDKRLACQLLYHTLCAMQSVDDEECQAVCHSPQVVALANQFHRVQSGECPVLGVANNPSQKTQETTMSDEIYRWYFHHSMTRNETKAAVAAALDSGAPLLLMVCKPSCAVCAKVWQALDATGRFADFLRAERVVALKIEDTASHFADLARAKNKYTGIDGVSGKKVNSTAPFFLLFVPAEAARNKSKVTLAPEQVAQYLSGFGGAKASAKTYNTITAWIAATDIMGGHNG